jgi:hypothetical protein
MTRATFLTIASMIALAVGTFAIVAPGAVLASKGVAASAAGDLWARELGIALLVVGVIAFLVRRHRDSPTLRAFLIGMALLQLGLLPIEIIGYGAGVITDVRGIIPNTLAHVVLAIGFLRYAVVMPRVLASP